jgi:hypothetical protein
MGVDEVGAKVAPVKPHYVKNLLIMLPLFVDTMHELLAVTCPCRLD